MVIKKKKNFYLVLLGIFYCLAVSSIHAQDNGPQWKDFLKDNSPYCKPEALRRQLMYPFALPLPPESFQKCELSPLEYFFINYKDEKEFHELWPHLVCQSLLIPDGKWRERIANEIMEKRWIKNPKSKRMGEIDRVAYFHIALNLLKGFCDTSFSEQETDPEKIIKQATACIKEESEKGNFGEVASLSQEMMEGCQFSPDEKNIHVKEYVELIREIFSPCPNMYKFKIAFLNRNHDECFGIKNSLSKAKMARRFMEWDMHLYLAFIVRFWNHSENLNSDEYPYAFGAYLLCRNLIRYDKNVHNIPPMEVLWRNFTHFLEENREQILKDAPWSQMDTFMQTFQDFGLGILDENAHPGAPMERKLEDDYLAIAHKKNLKDAKKFFRYMTEVLLRDIKGSGDL